MSAVGWTGYCRGKPFWFMPVASGATVVDRASGGSIWACSSSTTRWRVAGGGAIGPLAVLAGLCAFGGRRVDRREGGGGATDADQHPRTHHAAGNTRVMTSEDLLRDIADTPVHPQLRQLDVRSLRRPKTAITGRRTSNAR
jgi:hypothetical protein